ncbi:alpha/beta fold hydrolase [Kordiimonas sp.]|uniref:alpha/beta fold hydrolase n=1 Tax=Kordiimonas sp. TaxID=1970157 RepID=UPI003A943945
MKKIIRVATIVACTLCAPIAVQEGGVQAEETPEFKPCYIRGLKERLACADISLPENYAIPDGARVNIHVTRLPAKAGSPEKDPFVVFAGGPGQAAGDYGPLVRLAFQHIRAKRDILLIDQRGTGQSYGIRCESDEMPYPLERFTALARNCMDETPANVAAITMENVVRDTDEIRQRLGYEQLNLWGGSYGTRTVALYLKRYPEHVRSIIVDGVLPPDVSLFETAAASAERAVQKIIQDCGRNSSCAAAYPELEAQLDDLVTQAKGGELRYTGPDPVSGEDMDFILGYGIVVEALRSSFYTADQTTYIPFTINAAADGNLKPLISALLGGTAVSDSMFLGATFSILCGDEIDRANVEEIETQSGRSFAGDTYYQFWKAGCQGWNSGAPADDAFEPIGGDVPALVLSGDLDPITPPSMGEHFVKGFPNGRHIVVPGTGHNTSYVACMPKVMADFMDHTDVSALDTSCFDHLKRLPFATGLNGAVN